MTFLLQHLHPAVFAATVSVAIVATVQGDDLPAVCTSAGIAGLVAFAIFGALPLAWMRGKP